MNQKMELLSAKNIAKGKVIRNKEEMQTKFRDMQSKGAMDVS